MNLNQMTPEERKKVMDRYAASGYPESCFRLTPEQANKIEDLERFAKESKESLKHRICPGPVD